MARRPKSKKQGFSAEDLAKILLGSESMEYFRQIPEVESPRGGLQGNMAQQFGGAGLTADAKKLLAQFALAGRGVATSNVADVLGIKDAYLAEEKQSPINALWAAMTVAPISFGGKIGKTLRSVARTLRSGESNPRLETGSRTVAKGQADQEALIRAYIYNMLSRP